MSVKTENRRKKPIRSLERRLSYSGWIFISPFVAGMALLMIPILIMSVNFAFSNIKIESYGFETVYIGSENFRTAIFADPNFTKNMFSSVGSMLMDIPTIIFFSLFIAVLLNSKMRGQGLFRAIFLIPVILATGIIERAEINNLMMGSMQQSGGIDTGAALGGNFGIFNLEELQMAFLSMNINMELAEYVVSIVDNIYEIITRSGVQILIFLAGLQSVSPEVYEAANVEGATAWESFWKITLPLVSPIIIVNTVYTIIDSFTRANNSIMSMIYQNGFRLGKYGLASAMSWLYFIVIGAAIVAVLCLIRCITKQNAAGSGR